LKREFSWFAEVMAKMISIGGSLTSQRPEINPGSVFGLVDRRRWR
jgi:hypothetical protein